MTPKRKEAGLEQAATTPALASTVGRYSEAAPASALAAHFRCAWTHKMPDGVVTPMAVVPDGSVDLEWRNGRLLVTGPDVRAALPSVAAGTTVVGMRFQPGAASQWLGLPMSEIVGLAVDLADLWGKRAHELAGRLSDTPTVHEQGALLQRLLMQMSGEIEPAAAEAAEIFNFAGRGPDEDSAISLLRDRLEVSERTLRRRSHDYFGYGPKMLGRILRFQRFMSLAQAEPGLGLSALAFDAGYADQPHLSREIQALSGMTARTFLQQLKA